MSISESERTGGKQPTLTSALACLLDPPALAAIGLLLLNDHVLKVVVPSWLTGKLSDVAGLYFFPFLVLAALGLFEQLLPRRLRSPDRAMGLALTLSGLWFLALKATPTSNAHAVGLLDAVTGRANHVVADPTDLIALAVLPLAWRRWQAVVRRWDSRSAVPNPRRARWLRFLALALASFASLATPAQVYPVSFGVVFDVTADPHDGATLYASLATQRILKLAPARRVGEHDHASRVSEVEYTLEVYLSRDGGHTWKRYLPLGGYLWADPHTPDRLYVLNPEGLHRVDGGQARLLDVPFKALQVEFFPSEYYRVDIRSSEHALAFDPAVPDVLYLSDGARVLVSADAGETWQPLATTEAPDRVLALAVAPSAPQTLYAAAGGRVLRSDSGGESWSHTGHAGSETQIRALAIHPQSPQIVYAAGSRGIFRSTDGGETWRHVYVEEHAQLRAIVLHPEHPRLVYAAGHRPTYSDYGQALFSDDGGETWASYGGRVGYDVAVSPVAPHRVIVALGQHGVAVQESLQALPTPTPPLGLDPSDAPTILYADAAAFDPGDPTVSYALVSHPPALGRSDDGGASWAVHPLTGTLADPPIALAARLFTATEPVGLAGAEASLVALGQETAYGLHWGLDGVDIQPVPLPDGEAGAQTRPLLSDPAAPNLLLTAGAGGILRSEDGGRTWTAQVLSPTTSFRRPTVMAMAAISQSLTVYAAAEAPDGVVPEQIVFRSGDRGLTWEPRARLTTTHRLQTMAVHPADPDIVYGGGVRFYQSGDGGASWTLLDPETVVHTLAIVPGDPRMLYAITKYGAARSHDGGLTWDLICPAGQVDGPAEFLGIAIAPAEPHPVLFLARPTRPDLDLPATGTCRGLSAPQYDLRQGWQRYSEGLPVFFEEVTDR